jgi:hypothetical protein
MLDFPPKRMPIFKKADSFGFDPPRHQKCGNCPEMAGNPVLYVRSSGFKGSKVK